MSDTDIVPAAANLQDRVNALSDTERTSWELTGDMPAAPAAESDPDPEPEGDDEPVPPVPAPDGVTAEPVAPAPVLSKRQQKEQARQQAINDAIRRSTEAEQRATALEARLQALVEKAPAAEPVAAEPIVDPKDPEPQETDFEDYRAFVKAQSRWEIRQAKREEAAETAKATAAKAESDRAIEFGTRVSTWVERRDAFAAKTPTFAATAGAFLDAGFEAGYIRPGTPMGDVLMDSEVGPQLAFHLATHPDEAQRIARLAPVAALRALGKLEALFDSPTGTALAGPAAKLVSTAPAPAMTLSSRSADPADPAAAALARGDFSAWEAEENRKALSAAR